MPDSKVSITTKKSLIIQHRLHEDKGYGLLVMDPMMNLDVICYDSNRADTDITAQERTFPAEILPDSKSVVNVDTIPFRFGDKSDGSNNVTSCTGQNVLFDLISNVDAIFLLAYGDGDEYDDALWLIHQDSTSLEVWFKANDIRSPFPTSCAGIGLRTPFYYFRGHKMPAPSTIWFHQHMLLPATDLSSLKLPDNPFVHIVAITFRYRL